MEYDIKENDNMEYDNKENDNMEYDNKENDNMEDDNMENFDVENFDMEEFWKDFDVRTVLDKFLLMLAWQDFDREKLLKQAFVMGELYKFTRERIENDLLKLAFLASFKSDCYNDLYRSRSTREEKKWLTEVKTVYCLRVKRCTIPHALTLRRLAVAYARELSLQLHERIILPCLDADSLAPGFPVAMCLSSFACLIPTNLANNDSKIFMQAFCYFRLAYDKFAHPQPQRRFTKKEIENYVRKRSRAHPYTPTEKEEHLLRVELIAKEGDKYVINPAIKPALEEASQKWECL